MPATSILDFTPERSLAVSVRLIHRLMRGRPIDIHDIDDLASVVAFRFEIARREGRVQGDPAAFLSGIARNVYREAIRAKNRRIRTVFGEEIPDVPDNEEEDIHPVKAEFVDRFHESLTPNERSILPDFVWPGDRRWKEIAEQLGKSESAFSEAVRRLRAKAELLRRSMLVESLTGLASFPTRDAQDRIVALGWTPRERADFRLRLVEVCQSLAFTTTEEDSPEREQLAVEAGRHLEIVAHGFVARSNDPGLHGAAATFEAAQLCLAPLIKDSAETSHRYAAKVGEALVAYRSIGDLAGESAVWQLVADHRRFIELATDYEYLPDPHTVRIQRQNLPSWFKEMVDAMAKRQATSPLPAILHSAAGRLRANPTSPWS
jgi:DNA-directed RNA polymerase specialized sigma24 family protein